MKNLPEFKALILRYESITENEINPLIDVFEKEFGTGLFYANSIAKVLTGYGSPETCTLCQAVDIDCSKCMYENYHGCVNTTFDMIYHADSTEELLSAFKARAKYMRELLISKNIEI